MQFAAWTISPISRRSFVAAGTAFVAAAVTSCEALSTTPRSSRPAGADRAENGKEAPDLSRQVDAGDLPPVEERLPADPLVVRPVEEIGRYGGTWRTSFLGAANSYWIYYTAGYDGLVRWDPQWQEVVPNLAESVEASADGQEFTFTLRRGTKWSDGRPFTTEDISFSFHEAMLNEELMPLPPSFMTSASGKPARLTVIDDVTFRFVFDEPNGLFLTSMASQSYGSLFGDTASYPRHYMEKFHPKSNPAVASEVESAGFAKWTELFLARADYTSNTELPTLNAWRITTPVGDSNVVTADRNAYYWKTDPEGAQLPYIDRIHYDVLNDPNSMLLKAINGEFHFHYPVINTLQNKPVLARNQESGDYTIFDMVFTRMNWAVIALNLTHEDKGMRELFQNKDFRVGLSHAINRPQLIDAVFQRTGTPWQASPREESEFYDEEFATQFTEFDLDKANQHLDATGYIERNDEGIRLGPDGEPIFFVVDVNNGDPQAVDTMEFVRANWRQVGVDIRVNSIDRSLFYTRKAANQHDANVWGGDGGLRDAMLDPRWYFPFSDESNYAIPWASWFVSRGQNGQEPPQAPRRQMELYWELLGEPDADRRQELFTEILGIAKNEFYVIGTVLPIGVYGIKSNKLRNAPDPMILAYLHPDPGPDRPEQFSIES